MTKTRRLGATSVLVNDVDRSQTLRDAYLDYRRHLGQLLWSTGHLESSEGDVIAPFQAHQFNFLS